MEPDVRIAGRRIFREYWLLHSPGSKNQNRTVGFGIEFHADLLSWKWAIDIELLLEGEALSAPCYTVMKRSAERHYLSDASFNAVDGFCVEVILDVLTTGRKN